MIAFHALDALDVANLTRLADLVEAGLVAPPFTALGLQGHVPRVHVSPLLSFLIDLDSKNERPAQIAVILRAFAAGKASDPDLSKIIDVVVSGPDATSTTRDTGVVMRQLFTEAESRILAVGFAVHQGRSVFRTLAERLDSEEGLEVTLCLDVRRVPGSTSIDRQITGRFARNFVEHEWPGQRLPRVYFDPRSLTDHGAGRSALHSKCVVIDGNRALVTSANFTEAAQERNMELGLLVRTPEIASQIEEHFDSLIRDGYLERLPLTK